MPCLKRHFKERGLPSNIRSDNGVPFASAHALFNFEQARGLVAPPGHCLGRKRINFSTVFAGQAVAIEEVHDDIWLVSFMDYDLGYFDLETRVLEPLDNPFGPRLSPM